MTTSSTFRIGLISDTHGLLRPEAIDALRGSDFIVHAGDIGDPDILKRLAEIAPVTVVRGNNDKAAWALAIPESDVLQVGNIFLYVIHDIAELDIDAAAAGFHIVVSGHSHKPKHEWRDGVLFINPGSAGPRRFTLPISLSYLMVSDEEIAPYFVKLNDRNE